MALPKMVEEEVIPWLIKQDDLYENEGESEVSDADYDRIKRQAQVFFPHNKYFLGVGAAVRGGKVKLPFPMNGLTQVYENDTQPWLQRARALRKMTVLADKLDGTSSQILYQPDGLLQIGFSRGDGNEGADITRHLRLIPGIPEKIPATGKTVAVRAEIVIKKKDFPTVQKRFLRRDGSQYKNARNAVAGIMNSSENDPAIYQFLNCVAYTILESTESKESQFEQLKEWGFEIARHSQELGDRLTDIRLTEILNFQRASSLYDIDGLVLDLNTHGDRLLAIANGQPTSVKYKVADVENLKQTRVKEVLYRASKDGYLKPRVQFDPIELCEVTVTFATAFNAKYIQDNKIGPGSLIRITRSGDVIPFILGVDEPTEAQLPDPEEWGEWEWNENGVDAVLSDSTGRRDVRIRRFVDVFSKLKIDQLKEGSAEKLFDSGFTTIESIICATQPALVAVLGENGNKVYESLTQRLNGIYWPEFVGSLGFMGRGVGRKRMTALFNALEGDLEKMKDLDTICSVEGFQLKTATKVVDAMDQVQAFITLLGKRVTLKGFMEKAQATGSKMKGQAVVFTGVRSEALEKKIMEEGGEIKSGISSGVTILVAKDPSKNSSKMVKARELGIQIVDIRQMEKMLF